MDPISSAILLGIRLIGAGVSFFGQMNAAADREKAAQNNFRLSQMQADEIEARQKINNDIAREEMQTLENAQLSNAAARGVGSAGGIGDQIAIHRIATRNMELANRDVAFKVQMLRLGAQYDLEGQQNVASSERISALGGLSVNLSSSVMDYNKYSKSSTTTEVAKVRMNDFVGPINSWPNTNTYGPAFRNAKDIWG